MAQDQAIAAGESRATGAPDDDDVPCPDCDRLGPCRCFEGEDDREVRS